ncbi:MAG: alcohol dehydrogenase catalytic domain-containing protein [Bacilli bacterium]
MFTNIYKVTSPGVIEEFVDTVDIENKVVVKIDTMAICKADIRYYKGDRDPFVLEHKYPLAPIHEAVGVVIKDPTNTFKSGDKVILVPNSIEFDEEIKKEKNRRMLRKDLGENYCQNAIFRSSNADGFLRQYYSCEPSQLVKYDDSVESKYAVFSELLSVSNAAIRRIDFSSVNKLAIFGDGIMGYMTYVMIISSHPEVDLTVFGTNKDKLALFKKAKTFLTNEFNGEQFDTLIECVGGAFQENVIDSMISFSIVGADLILMGVSENKVKINTRKILEKGLSLKGVTRSSKEDFVLVSEFLNKSEFVDLLKPLVISINQINNLNDIYNCFTKEIDNKTVVGKNLLIW